MTDETRLADSELDEGNKEFKEIVELLDADGVAYLGDGLVNLMTGLGTGMDKSSANDWQRSGANRDWDELVTRFREDWISQKVVTIIPQDCTREWRTISTPEGQEADKQLKIRELFLAAHKWARLYGTSAILLDLKKAGKMETPLDLSRLKPGCINNLVIVDRTRFIPTGMINMDPLSPYYGYPEYYQLSGSTKNIHCSRFIRFEGTRLPMYENWKNQWYSDSTLIPLRTTMDNFHLAAQNAAQLVQEAVVDVVTVEGLQSLLTSPQGEQAVMKRFRMMKLMKSSFNVLMLDKTEEYSTKTVALNGVKDLIWEYLRIIAAAVGIPATRFLSASPDGMNATGESDLNNYIDLLKGIQITEYGTNLMVLDKVIQAHFKLEPYTYEWNCIFPESATQKQERECKLLDSLARLAKEGAISNQAIHTLIIKAGIATKEELGAPPPMKDQGEKKDNEK